MEYTFSLNEFDAISKKLLNRMVFKFYTWRKLPMAAISGMKLNELTQEHCSTSVKFKWLNQNPFKSTFWAVQGMTAEMSTGSLLMAYSQAYNPGFKFILVGTTAHFFKKAKGKTTFVCEGGAIIQKIITDNFGSQEAFDIPLTSKAFNEDNEVISEFRFDWKIRW